MIAEMIQDNSESDEDDKENDDSSSVDSDLTPRCKKESSGLFADAIGKMKPKPSGALSNPLADGEDDYMDNDEDDDDIHNLVDGDPPEEEKS